jgi:hypothetical protein
MDEETFQEYRRAYLEWLAEAVEKDKLDRAAGLSPLPRSKEEREAMYWALPREIRRRTARSKEWAEVNYYPRKP